MPVDACEHCSLPNKQVEHHPGGFCRGVKLPDTRLALQALPALRRLIEAR